MDEAFDELRDELFFRYEFIAFLEGKVSRLLRYILQGFSVGHFGNSDFELSEIRISVLV